MLLSGWSSAVFEATQSSSSSSRGLWDFCSTLALMGMMEPRGKVVDSAGPEKSSEILNKESSQCFRKQFPVGLGSTLTIHEADVEHQISFTVCVKHWVINHRVPVFGPAWVKNQHQTKKHNATNTHYCLMETLTSHMHRQPVHWRGECKNQARKCRSDHLCTSVYLL